MNGSHWIATELADLLTDNSDALAQVSAAAGKLKKQLRAVKEKAAELQQERVDSDSIIRLMPDRTARISLLSSAAVFLWIAAHAFGLFTVSGFTSVP